MTAKTLSLPAKEPAATDASHHSVQEDFFEALLKSKTSVAIFLVNGIRLSGKIAEVDTYAVKLEHSGSQVVLKHAIATVLPLSS